MSGLDQVLESLVQACTPTADDYNKRVALIDRIQTALDKRVGHVENLRVIPYGSFVSQFYNSTSDLDLAICGTYPLERLKPASRAEIFRGVPEEEHVSLHKLDRRTKTQLFRDVGARLLSAGLARRGTVEFILHARVPIVRFVDPASGIEVDLCLGNHATSFKAWSVAQVATIHPAFGKLFRVVKVWAKAHSINDGASHMFNSWCLTLIVIAFLQTYPNPPLLPPLHELLYDNVPDLSHPRLMQGGAELPAQVYEIMELRTKKAQEVYGSRPCKPLEQLFRDFVEDGGRKLRSVLAREDSFLRDTRVSAFYGKMLTQRPFAASYVLCVEDPFDDTDNTARTLGTWEGHPGTVHYVTSVFERTLRHLHSHIASASSSTGSGTGTTSSSIEGGPAAAAAAAALPGKRPSDALGSDCGASDCGTVSSSSVSVVSAAPGLSSSSSAPPTSSASLAATCVFLFGTELLSRLPQLSDSLLGRELVAWARGAVAGGRCAGEVHQELLEKMGAEGEFVSFELFKRRHGIKVHNEAKYATPEEREAAEAARLAAKKARMAEKRAARRAREAEKQPKPAVREGLEAAAADAARERDGCGGADMVQAAAVAAAAAALGGKQAKGAPRERAAAAAAAAAVQGRPRSSAAGGSSDEHHAAGASLPPQPPPPSRHPPHPSQPTQQHQPRARITAEGRAQLAKALPPRKLSSGGADPRPGPGSSGAGAGRAPRPVSAQTVSSDGSAAAASAAASGALRWAAAGAAAETAPRGTSGAGEAASTSAGAAAAAAAAAAGAGPGSRQRLRARRQSQEGPRPGHNSEAAGEVAAAARGAGADGAGRSAAVDVSAVEHALQGLELGGRAAKGKGKGPKAQQSGSGGGAATAAAADASSSEAPGAAAAAAAAVAAAAATSERRRGPRQRGPAAGEEKQQPAARAPRSAGRRGVSNAAEGGAAAAGAGRGSGSGGGGGGAPSVSTRELLS